MLICSEDILAMVPILDCKPLLINTKKYSSDLCRTCIFMFLRGQIISVMISLIRSQFKFTATISTKFNDNPSQNVNLVVAPNEKSGN